MGLKTLHQLTVESAYFEVIQIKKDVELSEIRVIRIHREREFKKMWMTDQECLASVQGVGVGLSPFSLVALLQTLACNVGGHTYIHTPESLVGGA